MDYRELQNIAKKYNLKAIGTKADILRRVRAYERRHNVKIIDNKNILKGGKPKKKLSPYSLGSEYFKKNSKLNKRDMQTLMEWVSSNCDVVKGNKCDECGTELEKTFIISKDNLPIFVWVCPKSEIYQCYKEDFEKRYNKHNDKS